MNGVITLGEMRAKGMTMLEGACHRCERRGRLRIDRPIAEHGDGVLDLRAIIAADCPRMRNPAASIYDMTAAAYTPRATARVLTGRA